MVACFAVLFGWHGGGRGQVAGAVAELGRYVDQGIVDLAKAFGDLIADWAPQASFPA
jgi:hypothetical protein